MGATTWIALGVIALIIAGAILKIVREKKKGVKCVGCPYAQQCAGKASCNEFSTNPNTKEYLS